MHVFGSYTVLKNLHQQTLFDILILNYSVIGARSSLSKWFFRPAVVKIIPFCKEKTIAKLHWTVIKLGFGKARLQGRAKIGKLK